MIEKLLSSAHCLRCGDLAVSDRHLWLLVLPTAKQNSYELNVFTCDSFGEADWHAFRDLTNDAFLFLVLVWVIASPTA